MKTRIFKITLTNWNEHNQGRKSTFKKTMIPNNFCSDAKMRALPVTHRWLFLGIILICGDHARDTVEMSERSLRELLESSKSIDGALDTLEQLQLLTYTIHEFSLQNRKEKKGKEENRKEGASNSKSQKSELTLFEPPEKPSRPPKATAPEGVNLVIKFYCDTWREVYRAERSPDIRGKDAGMLKTLTKDLGKDRAMELVKAYLEMRDSWFLTKRHDVPTLMQNLNAISLFAQNGQSITRAEINQIDKNQTMQNTLDAIRRGEV